MSMFLYVRVCQESAGVFQTVPPWGLISAAACQRVLPMEPRRYAKNANGSETPWNYTGQEGQSDLKLRSISEYRTMQVLLCSNQDVLFHLFCFQGDVATPYLEVEWQGGTFRFKAIPFQKLEPSAFCSTLLHSTELEQVGRTIHLNVTMLEPCYGCLFYPF